MARRRRGRRPRRDPAQRRRAAVGHRRARPARVEGAPRRSCRHARRCRRECPRATSTPASRGSCSTPPAAPIRAGPARASTWGSPPPSPARSRSRSPAGSTPATSAEAMLAIPAVGVDVASGTEAPRVAGARPAQGPAPRRAVHEAGPGRPSPSAQHRVRPDARPPRARSRSTRPAGGARSATSAVATCRRRSWPRSEQLEDAWDGLRHDPRFWAELDDLLAPLRRPPDAALPRGPSRRAVVEVARAGDGRRGPTGHPAPPPVPQARGPGPHGRPQDQQRPRPGAAHAAARQVAGHRRDRRRPARRRDSHGVRAPRPAVRRVHGRGGHPPPGPERAPDARARAPRSAASPRARRRSRTRSTRRCATG